MTFAARLSQSREARKLTLKQLGGAAGISQQVVWNYENRGDEPSASILFALADALGVDPRWLFFGEGQNECKPVVFAPQVTRIALVISAQSPDRRQAIATLLGVDFEGTPEW